MGQLIKSDGSNPAKSFIIRDAVADEADLSAALHSRIWRLTYANLAPPVMFKASVDERRKRHWRSVLKPNDRGEQDSHTIIALTAGTIAGFISVGSPRDSALRQRGEVKQLYVDQIAQGLALSKLLLSAGFEHLQALGYTSIRLAVVEGNDPAIKFYKAAGGLDVGCFTDPGPLWPSANRLIAWDQVGDPT
ncbi:MAG: GNAT family N-acetyltransferase [Paracoccaceae bacterium]|nr:GNAT family N-acetyltransferase [Paracoccaceae bacterium]